MGFHDTMKWWENVIVSYLPFPINVDFWFNVVTYIFGDSYVICTVMPSMDFHRKAHRSKIIFPAHSWIFLMPSVCVSVGLGILVPNPSTNFWEGIFDHHCGCWQWRLRTLLQFVGPTLWTATPPSSRFIERKSDVHKQHVTYYAKSNIPCHLCHFRFVVVPLPSSTCAC